mgnify:FL=1
MPSRRALLQASAAVAASGSLGAPLVLPAAAQTAGTQRLPDRPAPAIGATIDIPRTTLIDGRVIEPGAWRGKVLLVQLWATWCPFCRKQNPLLDQLWRARQKDGIELLGLSIDEKPDAIKRYVDEHGYRFPVARFGEAWWTAIGRPKGLPILWVIGRDARLKQIEIGEMFPEDIELLERWL